MRYFLRLVRRAARADAGMTLLEILIAMAILGLLATLGSVQLMGYLDRAKADTSHLQMAELTAAIDLFKLDVGRPPTSEEGLVALTSAPPAAEGWRGPYLRKKALLSDPWGRGYIYQSPGQHGTYDLSSLGADGKIGGERDAADIANWLN
jgi:general secretion pathway protein G